ncbi:MAG: S8 family peptidase [Terriglobales bacterium]
MKKAIAALTLCVVLGTSSLGWANDAKISPDLRGYNSSSPVPVVVQYVPGSNMNCTGLLGLLGCVVSDVLKVGGTVLNLLPVVNGVLATVDGSGIQSLSNDSNVVYISRDRSLGLMADTGTAAVNAPVAWKSNYTGSGIGVALIDSGVNAHPDFAGPAFLGLLPSSRVVYNRSFLPSSPTSADQYGHGTHIAGLIAGNGASSTGSQYSRMVKGIAPAASIVNLRVLDENGQGTDSAVIAAIQQAISLKSTYNIRVINLSLGRGVFESYKLDPLCQAVERAWKAGIVVVVAAGNNGRYLPTGGYGTINSPGNDPYAITVGAMKTMDTVTRTDDLIASYSSKGPTAFDHLVKPDVVAPGNLLVSTENTGVTLEVSEPGNLVPYSFYVYGGSSLPSPSYFALSGTSMATGVVSGVVADLLQAHPTLTPDQVKARLMKSAGKTFPKSSSVYDPATGNTYVDYYDVFTVGAGYVDLGAALANTDIAKGTAMSPAANYDSTSGNVFLSRDASSTWGTSLAWTPSAVYGPYDFTSGGSSVMWGATGPGGSSVMWGATNDGGTSVMWGATTDGGSSVMWGASGPPEGEK